MLRILLVLSTAVIPVKNQVVQKVPQVEPAEVVVSLFRDGDDVVKVVVGISMVLDAEVECFSGYR